MPDPVKRKEIIEDCKKGEALILEREMNSPYDTVAVAVRRCTQEKLGYIPTETAKQIIPEMEKNQIQFEAVIEKITGGPAKYFASLFGAKETPRGFDIVITKK